MTRAFYWLSASSDNFDATGNPTGYGFRYGRKEFHEWSEFKDAESTQAIDLTNFGLALDNPVDGDRGVSRNLTLSFSVSSNNYETVEAYLFQNTGDFSQLVWKGNAWGNTTSIGPPKLDAATTYNLYIWALKRTFKSDGSDDTFFSRDNGTFSLQLDQRLPNSKDSRTPTYDDFRGHGCWTPPTSACRS